MWLEDIQKLMGGGGVVERERELEGGKKEGVEGWSDPLAC